MIFILRIKDQENQVNIQDDLYLVIAIPVLEFIFLLAAEFVVVFPITICRYRIINKNIKDSLKVF